MLWRALAGFGAALLAIGALAVGLGLLADRGADGGLPWRPAPGATGEPGGVSRRPGHLTARVLHAASLRARPGGRRVATLAPRTAFGSPTILSVVRREPGWLAVLAPQLANGRVGWIAARDAQLGRVLHSIQVDLSERRLVLLRAGRVIARARVAIGRPGAATPRGRFAVTDRLRITGTTAYGCCAIALTARQRNIPQGWTGGDRIAIHATPNVASVGRAVSLGCLRTTPASIRDLMRAVPLGAPVFVRA